MSDMIVADYDVTKQNKSNFECTELSENPVTRTIWIFKQAVPGIQKGRVPHSVKATFEITYRDELK